MISLIEVLSHADIVEFLNSTEVYPILWVPKWGSNLGLVNFAQM